MNIIRIMPIDSKEIQILIGNKQDINADNLNAEVIELDTVTKTELRDYRADLIAQLELTDKILNKF